MTLPAQEPGQPLPPTSSGPHPGFFRATVAVVLVGVVLRLVQWLGNASLWLDELSLVDNILGRGPIEIVTRGLEGQVAPVGFLALEKVAVLLLGSGELALRIVPFVASVAALLVFAALAREVLGPIGTFVATAFFALNPLLISLGAVVKQYSTDVLVTVILLVALRRLWTHRGSLRSRILVGAGAGALGFLSIPSAMVAGAALVALAYQARRSGSLHRPGRRASVLLPLLSWGAVAAAAALWANALLTPAVHDFMGEYWTRAGAFAPPFSDYPTWVLDHLANRLLRGWFSRPYALSGVQAAEGVLAVMTSFPWAVAIVGVATLGLTRRHDLRWALAVFLPLLFSLGLSRLQLYPLETRTSVFLLPLLILLVGASTDLFVAVIPERLPWFRLTIPVVAMAVLGAILVDQHPMYRTQRTREIISELANRREGSEPVFAHSWARPALLYYGPRFGVTDGVRVARSDDLPDLLKELDAYRGQRALWVVFAHPPEERDLMLCYLDEIALETERVVLTGGMTNQPVSLHRYDLSAEDRWTNAAAATFPVTEEAFQGTNPRCRRQSHQRAR